MADINLLNEIRANLYEAYIEDKNEQQLLETANKYIHKPITLFDCTSKVIGCSDKETMLNSSHTYVVYVATHGYAVGQENNPMFETTTAWLMESYEPRIYDMDNNRRLCCRVDVEHNFAGHITIMETKDSKIDEVDFYTEKILCELVGKMWKKNNNDFRHGAAVFLRNLYNNNYEKNSNELEKQMRRWGINSQKCYFSIGVTRDISTDAKLDLGQDINILSAYCRVRIGKNVLFFIDDNMAYGLFVLDSEDEIQNISAELRKYTEEYHCCIGISKAYNDITKFRCFCAQAAVLARLGLADGNKRMYWFEEEYWDYLINCLGTAIDTDVLVDDRLKRLKQYDEQKGSELLTTLCVYLQNGKSITDTTKKMYIHRNTTMNRIDKINEIMQMDIEKIDDSGKWITGIMILLKKGGS